MGLTVWESVLIGLITAGTAIGNIALTVRGHYARRPAATGTTRTGGELR